MSSVLKKSWRTRLPWRAVYSSFSAVGGVEWGRSTDEEGAMRGADERQVEVMLAITLDDPCHTVEVTTA